jgi:hypothetical protein
VIYEYVVLWDKLEFVVLRPHVGDRFLWKWTPDGVYSASSAYRSFFLGMSSLLGVIMLVYWFLASMFFAVS